MKLIPVKQASDACQELALEMHGLLARAAADQRPVVLGLATGNTMVGLYAALVDLLRGDPVNLAGLTTFNLDEFLGLAPDHERSFQRFMNENLFGPLDLDLARCHFPDGAWAQKDPEAACAAYSQQIQGAGVMDMQLLGIGRNGHMGFNEPGSPANCWTRVVSLHALTRSDAAGEFGSLAAVPETAITMGMADIARAERLRLLAFGSSKAKPLAAALASEPNPEHPLSFLLQHPDFKIWADGAARGQES